MFLTRKSRREKVKLPKRKIGRYKSGDLQFKYVPERF